MDTAHVWHQVGLHSVYSTCSNRADRLETDRMESRQSSTGQADRKESDIDQGKSRLSSTEKVERREGTARTAIGWRGEMRQSGLVDMVDSGGGDTLIVGQPISPWRGGVVAPPPDPKPPHQTLSVSLPVCE